MRTHKGASVTFDKALYLQLKELVDNMELAADEANEVMKEVLQENADIIQGEINKVLEAHKDTGETLEHAIKPQVEAKQSRGHAIYSVDVGVRLSGNLEDMKHGNGGYASLLLDYGTPRKRVQKNPKRSYKHHVKEKVQHRFIGAAVRRGRKRCEKEGQEAFRRILERRLGK